MSRPSHIVVEGAETNNLKALDCAIPIHALTVITGVSGSGKSSLAFDTLYAEGQRRYVETLSTYARQFIGQMSKPPVRAIKHLPPAIALRQGNRITNSRSSVGTVSELEDLLHMLFAGAGDVVCHSCGEPVVAHTAESARAHLAERHEGARVVVVGEIRPDEAGVPVLLRQLAADGYQRLMVGDELVDIDTPEIIEILGDDVVRVVMDRLKVDVTSTRLVDALEKALGFGESVAEVVLWDDKRRLRYERRHRCAACGAMHHQPIPALFNPQSHIGRCARCEGHGRTVGLDVHKVVPDPRISLIHGAIDCFQAASASGWFHAMIDACRMKDIPIDVPWMHLSAKDRRFVMEGGVGFGGVQGYFDDLARDRYKAHVRIRIARYRGYTHCNVCDGSGLNEVARAVKVDGRGLDEILPLRVTQLRAWVGELRAPAHAKRDRGTPPRVEREVSPRTVPLDAAFFPLLDELEDRLRYLEEVGIGYLTIDRQARTLSGGETHRLLLATNLGRTLTDTCYVLDEPTAGLHPADTERLIRIMARLRDVGNTVVVVEHDPDVIDVADHVLEIGPLGGERGGEIMFSGDVGGLRGADTITGAMLRRHDEGELADASPDAFLEVEGAVLHNLKDVTARFAKRALNVVTGVSGSGKSTLVHDVLYQILATKRGGAQPFAGPTTVNGDDFAEVVLVDQSALNKSRRSNALTLSGAYDPIRKVFASTTAAAAAGMNASSFSFNVDRGRCQECEGTGAVEIDMHFLADVRMECPLCEGKRFQPAVLGVKYRDKSIADVFDMSIDEALRFFADQRSVVRRLGPMAQVGLGYLKLGQSTAEISGGEAQRLKLASYVGQKAQRTGEKLFIFDEPTVGLHMADVERLVDVMRDMVKAGHTVIVVEHNTDFVRAADWIVDLGPGPGEDGGTVVYEGPVSGLRACDRSHTGRYV